MQIWSRVPQALTNAIVSHVHRNKASHLALIITKRVGLDVSQAILSGNCRLHEGYHASVCYAGGSI
jgi:hypothetical protein